jgi:hypothetical protein
MKTFNEIVKPYAEVLKSMDYNAVDKAANPNEYLLKKWEDYIPKGWYGFDLQGTPAVWGKIIDDFLTELSKVDPDFEIHQIKLKFGGLRCYLGLKTVDSELTKNINLQVAHMEDVLYSDGLIY